MSATLDPNVYTKKGTLRKRKPKKDRNYFTQETEDYIVKYNQSTDHDYRAKIFTDHIYLPFYKLAENIIHTFKFYYTDVERIEDLKHEVVSVLLEQKIDKFDPTNGAKAYSYFGTITKNWLIVYNTKNYKKRVLKAPVDELFKDDNYSYQMGEEKEKDFFFES